MNTSADAMMTASMNARPRVEVLLGAVGTAKTNATASGYAATYATSARDGTGGGPPRTTAEKAGMGAPTPPMNPGPPSRDPASRRRPSDRPPPRGHVGAP